MSILVILEVDPDHQVPLVRVVRQFGGGGFGGSAANAGASTQSFNQGGGLGGFGGGGFGGSASQAGASTQSFNQGGGFGGGGFGGSAAQANAATQSFNQGGGLGGGFSGKTLLDLKTILTHK